MKNIITALHDIDLHCNDYEEKDDDFKIVLKDLKDKDFFINKLSIDIEKIVTDYSKLKELLGGNANSQLGYLLGSIQYLKNLVEIYEALNK